MKEGAGEDPFAEDAKPTESSDPSASAEPDEPSDSTEPVEPSETARATAADRDPSGDAATDGTGGGAGRSMRIPYKLRRDGVQDGRDRVPLFVHPETKSAERDALRELEGRFDGDVSLTDLREAVVMAGLAHLDEVEAQLEEWGYGMTFDE